MAGVVAVILRIMPEGPNADLVGMKESVKDVLSDGGAQNVSFTEEDLAFGLKSVLVKFAWPEEKDTDIIEKTVSDVAGVSSVKIEDYRRAFG